LEGWKNGKMERWNVEALAEIALRTEWKKFYHGGMENTEKARRRNNGRLEKWNNRTSNLPLLQRVPPPTTFILPIFIKINEANGEPDW